MKFWASSALFVLLVCAAHAQQGIPGNFFLTTPMQIESGRMVGAPDGLRPVTDEVTIITAPTLSLIKLEPRSDFEIFYRPEFEMYANNRGLSSWNHSAGFTWNFKLTSRWEFDARDLLYSTEDNDRRMDSAFLLGRGRYDENGLNLSLSYLLTPRTKVRLRYENSWVKFNSADLPSPLYFNRMVSSVGADVERELSPRARVALNYDRLTTDSLNRYDANGYPVAPTPVTNYIGATVDYAVTRSLLVEMSGGHVKNQFSSYSLSAGVEQHFRYMLVGFGYSRYLSMFGATNAPGFRNLSDTITAAAVSPNSISQTISFHVRGNLSRKWALDVNGLGSRTGDGAGAGRPLTGAIGSARLSYKLAEHFALFGQIETYSQNANAMLPVAVRRQGFFGGIEYTFSPTPEQLSQQRAIVSESAAPLTNEPTNEASADKTPKEER